MSCAVVGADGDADGGLERDGDAAQREGLLERAVQAGGDLGHRAAVGQVGEQDRELVAAEAGERRRSPRRAERSRAATSMSSWSPWSWPRVSLTSLKRSRSMSSSAARRPCLRASGQRARALPAELRAVREPGQRVVQRLAAQPARGAGRRCRRRLAHRRARPRPSSGDDERRVALDGVGDRGVGQVGLERALDRGVGPPAQRHVDLEQLRALADVRAAVLDLGVGGAAEGAQQAGVVLGGAVEGDLAVVGPDGGAVAGVEAGVDEAGVLAGGLARGRRRARGGGPCSWGRRGRPA